MNTFAHFPAQLHWTAQQLADAVPQRLHQLFSFDAQQQAAGRAAANGERRRPADLARYTGRSSLPTRFDVR